MSVSKGAQITLAVIGAVAILVVLAVVVTLGGMPMRILSRFPAQNLMAEAQWMDECTACHDAAVMHTCDTCHDEHGGVEMARVPFNGLILLTGDVPEPAYIAINDLFPDRTQRQTVLPLLDFLAQYGVADFESVTLASSDGGLVSIARSELTPAAMLMPHVDAVRFAAEDLHVSTWLKGVVRIVVVGKDKPLQIGGQATSIGRLLLGPTTFVTLEQTDVMLQSETDGQVRRAKTASRAEGAPVSLLVPESGVKGLRVRDDRGKETVLTPEEAQGAVLALMQGKVTLVLPERGRSQWVSGVVNVEAGA